MCTLLIGWLASALASPVDPDVVHLDALHQDPRDGFRVAPPVPVKDDERRSMPVDLPGRNAGFLSDRAVYLSQCHGYIWYESLDSFSTQRGNVWDTVEDIHNPEAMDQYLTAYLENAGAAVYTAKERDLNPRLAIADNDGEGYTESGSGFVDGPPGFEDAGIWAYDENPFSTGSTRKFPATAGAKATWIPDVPEDGYYAVYVAWDSDANNATDAHYRLKHPGGVIDRNFNQTVHGSTWQYVDTLWLPEGTEGLTVELLGDSTQTGRFLSADAVRIGGGTGVIERHGETTGRPRFEEGAILGTQYNGAPPSVYDPYDDGDGSDPSSRSRWADWEHPSGEDAVYLSWHSNAATGTARGTITYFYDATAVDTCSGSTPAIAGSEDLATLVQDEIVTMADLSWETGWRDRGVGRNCFSENSPTHNDEMPSVLVELAFHDNETDATFLKNPEFRRDAARAMYRGIARYFAARDGVTPTFLPEPPVGVQLIHDDGELQLSWNAGPAGFPDGDAAQSYRVYTSADGLSWDNGMAVTGRNTVIAAEPGEVVYARVVGVNAGGYSFPSEIVAARRSGDGTAVVLVVSAFDRLDSGLLGHDDSDASLGDIVRMNLRQMNGSNILVTHGDAIDALGWPFDSASDEAFDDLDLSPYDLIVWATGEESTVDETFSTAQQSKVRAFWNDGGALWATGAEILWDLDERGTTADRAFAAEVLGAAMASDDANTDRVAGQGILDGLDLDFGLDRGGEYPVEYPDTLTSSRPVIATYSTGGVAAVLGDRVALFGFPFDDIGDVGTRHDVAAAVLPALLPDYVPPEDPEPDTDTDADSDSDTDADTDADSDTDTDVPAPDGAGGPGTRFLREAKGCGCDGSGGSAWWLAGLAWGLARRRR